MSKIELYPFYPFDTPEGVVTVEENVAAFKHPSLGHYCGYCVISNDYVPDKAKGNYNAPGMQYLAVHGGITFAEGENDTRTWKGWIFSYISYVLTWCSLIFCRKVLRPWYNRKHKRQEKEGKSFFERVSLLKHFTVHRTIEQWIARHFSTHQVYGFDCNHVGDQNNTKCRDEDWVLQHSKDMMFMILQLFQQYDDFLRMSREEQMKVIQDINDSIESSDHSFKLGVVLKSLQGEI